MADKLGVNARNMVESLNDLGAKARELGVERVAKEAGVKPAIVKKFVADAMKSKNSDVRKIRLAIEKIEGAAKQDAG